MTDEEMVGAADEFLAESLASFQQRAQAIESMAASLRRDISVFRRMNAAPAEPEPAQDTGPNYMGKDD